VTADGTGLRRVAAVGQEVRVPKMAELVAADLRRRIVREELNQGDSLAPEAALMTEYGVSRPTLREAFRILEAESLIVVRRGAGGGARVQTPNPEVAARYAGFVLEHRGTTVKDVWDARLFLEPPTAGLLAQRRTQADLRRLREALAEHDQSSDPAEIVRLHNEFHTLIVELAGNDTLLLLIGMLGEIIDGTSWSRVAADLGTATHHQAERGTVKVHHTLVNLIEAKDAEAAENLWRRHLKAGSAYLAKDGRGATVLDLLP
jgi:GntR family transcriptional repressor for pyruvate dehydrogenase complex